LGRTLRLNNKTTILEKMKQKQITNKNITYQKWSDTKIGMYNDFNSQAKLLNAGQWEKVN
jgi:hypothetical protein